MKGTGEYYRALFSRSAEWPVDWEKGCVELAERAPRRLIVNEKDGTVLVLVPGGKFLAGGSGSDESGGLFEVELAAYYLGAHPVTNGQYARFVKETKYEHRGSSEKGAADHPVVEVSWDDAKAYCGWTGLRLPTELEWEKGARGLDGRDYPWGKDWRESLCRNVKNRGSEETAGVWKYGEGASPLGGYQHSGNVWEWCEDWYDKEYYERLKAAGGKPGAIDAPRHGATRVLRGGSWNGNGPENCRAAYRYSDGPGFRNVANLGFRVARTV